MTQPPPDRRPVSDVPKEVVEECFAAWLENDSENRTAAIESLCAGHPDHADGIRELVTNLGSSDGLLHRVSEDIEAPPNSKGRRIGSYEIEDLLGYGGFGAVFRALQHEPVRRRVALKVLQQIGRAHV